MGTDAAYGVEVVGETVYIATSPLRAIDVSDSRNPREIGSVSTPLVPHKLTLVGELLYAAADFAGLLVYRVRRE
jgi:hypothetical protein